jgi:hypothetical protein
MTWSDVDDDILMDMDLDFINLDARSDISDADKSSDESTSILDTRIRHDDLMLWNDMWVSIANSDQVNGQEYNTGECQVDVNIQRKTVTAFLRHGNSYLEKTVQGLKSPKNSPRFKFKFHILPIVGSL